MNATITKRKAYGSKEDNVSRYPKKNFTDVVPLELVRKYNQTGLDFDVLILQSSSTDITNLDTKTNEEENVEYLKLCATVSSQNMFNVATNALKHTDIKKVIILERIPRYDLVGDDPSSLKSGLSEFGNGILHQLWLQSEFKDKIIIGKHDLECSSDTRKFRYGNDSNFDGIHLNGFSGRKSYTRSVLDVLTIAGLVSSSSPSPRKSEPSSAASWLATYSQRRGRSDSGHTNCEQAVYQRSQKNKSSSKSSTSKSPSTTLKKQHRPVFFNRGNIDDFYYNRNIFDVFHSERMSGN